MREKYKKSVYCVGHQCGPGESSQRDTTAKYHIMLVRAFLDSSQETRKHDVGHATYKAN